MSNASEDLPDPLTPVTTVIALCGISTLTFFRLWTRAPRMEIVSLPALPTGCADASAGMSSFVPKASPDSTATHRRVWWRLPKL